MTGNERLAEALRGKDLDTCAAVLTAVVIILEEERERCAKICDNITLHQDGTEDLNKDYLANGAEACASAIREL